MGAIKSIIKKLQLNKTAFLLLSLFSEKNVSIDADNARNILEKTSAKPTGKCFIINNIEASPTVDLQIIVPAYNVQDYLGECIESILSQKTGYSYNITIVDDGSTDSTGEIADRYLSNPLVTVIHQNNKGFSGARNTALKNIIGRYITFVDSDDILADGAIDAWLDVAFSKDAEIVEGGFYRFSDKENYISYKYDAVRQVEALGNLKGFACGKVYKNSIFSNLAFPEGFWFEDSINSLIIYPKCKKAFVIPEVVYGYRLNPDSISSVAAVKPKCIDSYYIFESLLEEAYNAGYNFNERYRTKFFYQSMTNYDRIRNMPQDVKESVFVLTCEMYKKYFGSQASKNQKWHKAFLNKDLGTYNLLCKFKISPEW